MHALRIAAFLTLALNGTQNIDCCVAQQIPVNDVELQPLRANVSRLCDALDYLGHTLPGQSTTQIRRQLATLSAAEVQEILDRQVLCCVSINPELRVKVQRGPAKANLQQSGFVPVVVKIINDATVARPLRIHSPQAGPIYAGGALPILERQAQTELADNENTHRDHRFLTVEMFDKPPMTAQLSGLEVEYMLALISSTEAGKRDATIAFDIGQGTQDLGFRSQTAILFEVEPAIPVQLSIRDMDGLPTTAKLMIRDSEGRIYPPQARRLAPDFFFQPQVYRHDGQTLKLPPGQFTVTSSRGPEYLETTQTVSVTDNAPNEIEIELQRWINPMQFGYYCGDHHIHGAGCSHYDNPTLGVTPADMFAQVKGEGLNVGCVLTWGPCFEHQRTFFSPQADATSEPKTLIKYDLEISGFGSAALGHVCLLNLKNQTYPGSNGSKIEGWPSWTVPVMRWAKEQGGVTGYPHSALHVNPESAATYILINFDLDGDKLLDRSEAAKALLPSDFSQIDSDRSGRLDHKELKSATDHAADELPNVALPAMDGGGAMEVFVSTAEGVCDFISAMDTARISEWNSWYHLMNCGFPLKLSGETDFPCMSSRRVGQGRVYVRLGETENIDFSRWCRLLGAGRSYISDGFAHAIDFQIKGKRAGEEPVNLDKPERITVKTTVAFAETQPRAVAYGTHIPGQGKRMVGDTINLHAQRDLGNTIGGERLVEVVVNGLVVESKSVPADGKTHPLQFDISIEQSSWVAIRQFPQLHTNPILISVADQPIRASRKSAVWCMESIKRLWQNRNRFIKPDERDAAKAAYQRALHTFAQRASESNQDGSAIPNTDLIGQQ